MVTADGDNARLCAAAALVSTTGGVGVEITAAASRPKSSRLELDEAPPRPAAATDEEVAPAAPAPAALTLAPDDGACAIALVAAAAVLREESTGAAGAGPLGSAAVPSRTELLAPAPSLLATSRESRGSTMDAPRALLHVPPLCTLRIRCMRYDAIESDQCTEGTHCIINNNETETDGAARTKHPYLAPPTLLKELRRPPPTKPPHEQAQSNNQQHPHAPAPTPSPASLRLSSTVGGTGGATRAATYGDCAAAMAAASTAGPGAALARAGGFAASTSGALGTLGTLGTLERLRRRPGASVACSAVERMGDTGGTIESPLSCTGVSSSFSSSDSTRAAVNKFPRYMRQ